MVVLDELVTLWTSQSVKPYATPKVREDVHSIVCGLGVRPVLLDSGFDVLERVPSFRSVFLQYPLKPLFDPGSSTFGCYRLLDYLKDYGLAVLVHDIKFLQKSLFDKNISFDVLDEVRDFEKVLFSRADVLIVHSDRMAEYMSDVFGIPSGRFVCLDMFDYLSPVEDVPRGGGVAFAGYLGKSKYSCVRALYEGLPVNGLSYNLYGADFDSSRVSRSDLVYRGVFSPEVLPQVLRCENFFGLVWDSLTPKQREYYELIVPHKASLYIRAGIPLIVPDGTNISRFVVQNGLGMSIRDLQGVIDVGSGVVDFGRLQTLQGLVGSGYFTKKALLSACDAL